MIGCMAKRRKKTDLYAGQRPVDIPTYTFTDAARYLGIPLSTLRSWAFGQRYKKKRGEGFFEPLIELEEQEAAPRILSFTNLIEAHVLDAMRRVHDISMNKVRQTLEYVLRQRETAHPLAHEDFETDGVDIFVQELGALVSASNHGQTAMREVIQVHLQRIERDEKGVAERLYPFTRPTRGANEPRVVVIDPRVSFGQPVLTGTGIKVSTLVERFQAGESFRGLANDYDCKPELIEEAIRCALPKAA